MRGYALGAVRRQVAVFEWRGRAFSLVPRVEAELGFAGFEPSPAQRESWREVVEGYGLAEDPNEHLRRCSTTRLRRARIGPFLIEQAPREIGLRRVEDVRALLEEDEDLREELEDAIELVGRGDSAAIEHDRTFRVLRAGDGAIQAFVIENRTREAVMLELAREGFRLPSSDEWEYACGAGARTLFRWGDDCPCDRNALAPGPQWLPNALGLTIAWNPYKAEIVAEPALLRGGDLGGALCGGMSELYGWLPLATSFAVEAGTDYWGEDWDHVIEVTGRFARRVIGIE